MRVPTAHEVIYARADRLEAEARALMAEWESRRDDLAYLTQPAAGTAFAKRRDKALKRHLEGCELLRQADGLRERADLMERIAPAVPTLAKGTPVQHAYFGAGIITRVNASGYAVLFTAGTVKVARESVVEVQP